MEKEYAVYIVVENGGEFVQYFKTLKAARYWASLCDTRTVMKQKVMRTNAETLGMFD